MCCWNCNWLSVKSCLNLFELDETTLLKSIHRVLIVVDINEVLLAVGVAPEVLVKFNLFNLLDPLRVG